MWPKDIIVVDNFYDDPETVRRLALNAEYDFFSDNIKNFPGAESQKAYFTSAHIYKFEELIGKSIDANPMKFIFGKFRSSTVYDTARTKVHLDWSVSWTGIIYLTLDEDCCGGLGIYRHRSTGLDRMVSSLEELRRYGCNSIAEFDQRYILPISNDTSEWDLLYEIPMKFNRLVLFPGSQYFHGITQQFGDSLANSRLTQNFFFNEA